MEHEQPVGAGSLLFLDASASGKQVEGPSLRNTLKTLGVDGNFVKPEGQYSEQLCGKQFVALILNNWKANRFGIDLLRDARKHAPDTPIIVIGFSGRRSDVEVAYDCGADNYFDNSCAKSAIAARLKRLIRRQPIQGQTISVCDLQIWKDSGVAFRSGKPIKLSRTERDLLLYLVEHRSHTVSRAEILKNVFGLSFEPGTNVVEVHIHRLRRKIDGGHTERLLNTIRGSGYMLGERQSQMVSVEA